MRRGDKEITDRAEIEKIIAEAPVCRIGLCDGETPYIVPMSFGYRDGCLYLHSAGEGRKIDLIRKNNRVCFEVETGVEAAPGVSPCKWSMKYRSAVGYGRAAILDDPRKKREALEIIFRHYSDAAFDLPENAVQNLVLIKIPVDSLSGKISGLR